MKMLATKIALVAFVALATLPATEAAFAQSFSPGSQSYEADQSRVRGHNYRNDQRTIDEITNNDWNAGR